MSHRAVITAGCLSLFLLGCEKDSDPVWAQFNAEDDSINVEVGVESVLDPVVIDLTSTTGHEIIGTASVNPGGGPIGTVHEAVVQIDSDYASEVGRVTVRTQSGERGEDEYVMSSDSADEGLYALELTSVGDSGEVRTDTFTFRLWYDSSDGDTSSD